MWQTKYASAVPKNLGLGLNFRPCSEGYFLSGRPYSVMKPNETSKENEICDSLWKTKFEFLLKKTL